MQYKVEGCKVFEEGKEGYKFLWKRENDKRGGVGILIREELEKGKKNNQKNNKNKNGNGRKSDACDISLCMTGRKTQEEKEEF